jgi:low temperature requirement protein LtrA
VKEAISSPYSAGSADPGVSSLELFFDLVFVFTITLTPLAQLASLVVILAVGAMVDAAVTNRHAIR